MEGRIVAPPPVPLPVPLTTHRAEHVAAHDEGLGGNDLVDLRLVFVGSFEHPGVQPVAEAVAAVIAERALLRLVETGRVSVCRDRDVADHPAHAFSHCPTLLMATAVASR